MTERMLEQTVERQRLVRSPSMVRYALVYQRQRTSYCNLRVFKSEQVHNALRRCSLMARLLEVRGLCAGGVSIVEPRPRVGQTIGVRSVMAAGA